MPRSLRAPAGWTRALVTGASSGIGRAFATRLAADGTELVVVARRADRLDELAAEIADSGAPKPEVLVADLADAEQRAAVESRLADRQRPVDLLVNNAGFGTRGFFAELPVEREEAEIRLNALAPVCLARAALPGMLERRRGGILNVSSMAGLQPLPGWATYAATKAFLTTFSQSLHEEVRAHGVSVLALMPGFTRTEFHDHASMARSYVPGALWMTADDVARSALRALQRGRAAHVPGWYYQAVALLARMAPWSVSRRIVHAADRRIPTG
ncbi:MAG TPA: SDR family oxidoreductase [Acidimicrobiales bacterium]|nr:SDR family oxidoreductase [Acidimicrobiales bacterium]